MQSQSPTISQKTIFQLVNQSFKLVYKSFFGCFVLLIMLYAISLPLLLLVKNFHISTTEFSSYPTQMILILIVTAIIQILLFQAGHGAMMLYISGKLTHTPCGIFKSFRRGLKQTPRLLLANIVYTLLSLTGIGVCATAIALTHYFGIPISLSSTLDTMQFLQIGLWITIICIAVYLSCYIPVAAMFCLGNVAIFQQNVIAALRSSFKMSRGHFWKIATVMTIPFLILSAMAVLGVCLHIPEQLPNIPQNAFIPAQQGVELVLHLLLLMGTPLITCFYITQLHDLKQS